MTDSSLPAPPGEPLSVRTGTGDPAVNPPATFFAPAERATSEQIDASRRRIDAQPYVLGLLDAQPEPTVILNPQRQIVASNDAFKRSAGVVTRSSDELYGMRVGEALACINVATSPGGCGTGQECRMCGAVLAQVQAVQGRRVTEECRMTSRLGDCVRSSEFRATATPFAVEGEPHIVFSLTEIADEKRRRVLERTFFHDVVNTAGAIKSLTDLYYLVDEAERRDILKDLTRLSEQLLDEIHSQRDLLAAERGDLRSASQEVIVMELLRHVRALYRSHDLAKGKAIFISGTSLDAMIQTDPVLLTRVLGNLLKNALEASHEGDSVTLHFERTPDGRSEFSVHNRSVLPEQVRLQMFQRSFSTKGSGRGIGSYSVRLLTERYLRGTVSFTSAADHGTTFRVTLP